MAISNEDKQWLERFYTDYERMSGKQRPDNWLERGERILTGQRKPCGWKTEGLSTVKFDD